ncbi:MAG: hypothetical protein NWS71_03380 [Opitutales bacterium]|nr:hypothetical protein [Opitutales bacterium]
MRHSAFNALYLYAMILVGTTFVQGRTWTDTNGRQLIATIQGVRNESVTVLRESDQRRLTLSLDQLIEPDQEYAKSWAELQVNLRKRWPSSVKASGINVEQLPASEDGYSYATPHFRFHCDAELSNRLISHVATIFEVVYSAGLEIPLPIKPLPQGETHSVQLFKSTSDYEAAGAHPGSAGTYSFKRREVLVPLSSLAASDDAGVYRPESNPDYPTLIHEITHCITSDWRSYSPVWLFEGFARYMEVVSHSREQLNFDGLTPRLAVWRSGNGSYDNVPMVNFEFMLGCSYQKWDKTFYNKPENLRAQYTTAMVLVQYFLEIDSSNGERFKQYIFELSQGMEQQEALNILLNGRSFSDLTRDIVAAYQRERITFNFVKVD